MDWLFELSAACVLIAIALPFAWKLLPPKPALQPARVRTPTPSTDQDHSA